MADEATPGPAPETFEDYWSKAHRLADELRRHLTTMPVPKPKGPAGERGQVGWMGGEWDR